MGKCYKLFKDLKTQIEAQMACSEQNGILTKPLTYIESEFLEAFVNYIESIKTEEDPIIDKIWLNYRSGNTIIDPNDYFSHFTSLSSENILSQDGNCLIMKIESGQHLGWHREKCNEKAFYICETSNY